MDRVIYERTTSFNGSVIGSNDYLAVTKKASLRDRILLSPVVKYGLTTAFAIACLMTLVYLSMYFALNNTNDNWLSTCNVRTNYRVDCFPGRLNVSYEECNDVDCCWDEENKFCFHSIPSRHGYTPKNGADYYQENDVLVPRRPLSSFGSRNIESLSLHLTKHSDPNHVEFVFKINSTKTRGTGNSSGKEKSFDNEIPGEANTREDSFENILHFLPKNPASRASNVLPDPNSNMYVHVHTPEFSVTVTRKNNISLLSTARGPLILTDNYWEMTLFLTNSTVYGLNKLELNGTTNWIYDNENGTSRIAFLGIDDNGESASCYVSHFGPMEIKVIDGSNLIVLRGFSLPGEISFHVFAGPTPLEAIAQLTKALRDNDDTIDTFNLGLHVCPNEKTDDLVTSLNNFIGSMKNTPWDSHCIHQNFFPTMGEKMDSAKITVFENSADLLSKENEKRFIVPHLTPMVYRYNELAVSLEKSSLLLKNDTQSYAGCYKSSEVYYPDWHDKKTHQICLAHLNSYLENFNNAKFIYLRDSWPKDERKGLPFPDHSTFDYLPPMIQNLMGNGTIPYTLVSSSRGYYHYTEHASYSSDFSNFVRQRKNLTSHLVRGLWGESGNSTWAALTAAIRAGIGSGIVGQLPSPMYACGSSEKLPQGANSDELCDRWFGASVAWPHVLAIHSNLPGGNHVSATSQQYVIKHLQLRSSLMTYARTIVAQFFNDGLPLLSPTSVYYPEDLRARHTPNQFMWGYGILVGLVTLPKVYQASMFLPGNHPWKLLSNGIGVEAASTGFAPITVTKGQLVTLIKPGSIIPVHENIATTSASTIKENLTLKIHRACVAFDCNAHGTIFFGSHVSDGKFLKLSANLTHLKLSGILSIREKACNPIEQATIISKIIVYNYPNPNKQIDDNIDLCEFTTDEHDINIL